VLLNTLYLGQLADNQAYQIASQSDRRKCRYWQQSGCILDELEKTCEGDSTTEQLLIGRENVFLCCCPRPYKACKRSEADEVCLKLMGKYLTEFKGDNPITESEMLKSLQNVRQHLLAEDRNCQKHLAAARPFAECHRNPSPFTRHDLICEMLTWQWEELGDGNQDEFRRIKCPFITEHKSKNGNARKGAKFFLKETVKTKIEEL